MSYRWELHIEDIPIQVIFVNVHYSAELNPQPANLRHGGVGSDEALTIDVSVLRLLQPRICFKGQKERLTE